MTNLTQLLIKKSTQIKHYNETTFAVRQVNIYKPREKRLVIKLLTADSFI